MVSGRSCCEGRGECGEVLEGILDLYRVFLKKWNLFLLVEDEVFFFSVDLLEILIGIQGILLFIHSFYLSIVKFLVIYFILGIIWESRALKWNLRDCIIDFFFFFVSLFILVLDDTLLEVF